MRKALLFLTLIFSFSILNIVNAATQELTSCAGWYESLYATWSNDSTPKNASVYYKKSTDTEYTKVDNELIRSKDNGGIVDIVGLSKGNYDIKIVTSTGTEIKRKQIPVDSYDRSGYAHFNYTSGVGAYNDDGTPKENADIIYVTNDTKNTVTYSGYTGIGSILSNAKNFSNPVIIRIIGTVDTCLWDLDKTQATDLANGRTPINNLTSTFSSNDTYLNMADVKYASNITVEGIGEDATIDRWGFTFSHCKSIEVRNITFQNYPEDACSFQGGSNSNLSGERFWLHNCKINQGLNWCDLTEEQDKGEGDGSTDLKYCQYVTYAYNHFYQCHKTSLHGGGDSQYQYHITWHHNYFEDVSSRMPLVRQANVHLYNNYYYSGTNCIDARASAWVFSEANYFEDCTYAYKYTSSSSYGNPVIKTYNDVLSNSSKTSGYINTASSRTTTYTYSDNSNPYPNFDTDSTNFYYDSTNKVSNVEYLTSAATAKTDCLANSGPLAYGEDIEGQSPLMGDVNENSELDKTDMTVILKYITSGITLSNYSYSLSDADDNGSVDILDVIYIANKINAEPETEATTYVLDLTNGLSAGTDYNGISVLENMSYKSNTITLNDNTYSGYVAGSSNPSLSNGIPTSGAVFKFTPTVSCNLKLVFKLNNNKTFYFLSANGTEIEAYKNGTGSNAFYEKTYSLTAGEIYYAYASGSKIPIYYISYY